MIKPRRFVFSAFLLLFALDNVRSQGPSKQDASKSDVTPIIRQTVQEVLLDVVVRDSRGRFVKNLKPGDLEVFEDGIPQEIRSFKLVQGRDVLATEKSAPPAMAPNRAPANPLKAVNLICFVFDNLDFTNPDSRKYASEAIREFLKNPLEPDTWLAVFNLDSQLVVLQPFTTNPQDVLAALNKSFTGFTEDFVLASAAVLNATPNSATIEVSANGDLAHGGSVTATQRIAGGEINTKANVGADVSTSEAANRQRGDLAQQHREFGGIEGMRQMDQLEAMIRQLGTLPGRKSVILLTPGLATTGDPDLFKAVVDKANKAGVSIYGLDTNGLSADLDPAQASSTALSHAASVSSSQAAQGGSAQQNMEKMRQGDYVNDAVRTSDAQAPLRALSEGTGGFLIGNTNDFRKPFQRLLEEVDTHYEVIYSPSSTKWDGKLRNIEVKSPRAGMTIESQTGYYALPVLENELAPYEMAALAALNVHRPPHAFDFKAAAYQFRPAIAASQDDIVFSVPAADLKATPETGAGRSRMHVAVFALVKDSTGQVVDKYGQDSPYEMPDANLEKARATNIVFSHPLSLAPGHYTIDTVVLDREANRSSTGKLEFESPENKGVGISSVLLVQGLEPVRGKIDPANPLEFQSGASEGRRVIPNIVRQLTPTSTPYAYFVVYPDKSLTDKPKIQAEFLVDGKLLAKQVADLPAPDATGAIPMVINTAAKSGACELRITAMQGGSTMKQSLTYTVAAK